MTRWWYNLFIILALLASHASYAQQVPMTPVAQIEGLQKAVLHYQSLEQSGAWDAFPEDICVQPGTQDRFVPKVRNLLCLTQDLTHCATQDSNYFDTHLVEAVKRFQKRHGLPADGIVGCNTLTALNVPPAKRLQQLQVNLARWQDSLFAPSYPMVLVNVTDYTLHLLNNQAQTVWQTRVVVGQMKQDFQTKEINSKIGYLVVRPTWNLPKSIIRNEVIPAIRKDARYLDKNYMSLYKEVKGRLVPLQAGSVNWKTVDATKITIIQNPGPWNALGQIKFIFHNPFDIYLHDTPAKALFNHPVRAYSHGCVRVEHPEKLASYLLSPDWGKPASFSLQAQKGQNEKVFLPKPVAIQIRYFTSWVDAHGTLQFREDIYGLDALPQLSEVR